MKNNKKAFTLIELLAVIIILGIILLIAIPSVSHYISISRKQIYEDTARIIIKGAITKVNSGEWDMYDTGVNYYIPQHCIKTEKGSKTPYGEFTEAYVGVTYDGNGYSYYWISNDTAGHGFKEVISSEKINKKLIESNIKDEDIKNAIETTSLDKRKRILILNDNCEVWDEEIKIGNDNTYAEFDEGIIVNTKMVNLAGDRDNIMKIIRNYELPEEIKNSTNENNILSLDSSPIKIYGWYNNNEKIIYYYTEAEEIFLNANSSSMFRFLNYLERIDGIDSFNTSKVINMKYLFQFAGLYANTWNIDLSKWDTSQVTNMDALFDSVGKRSTTWNVGDLSNWNTSKVTTMVCLFCDAGYNALTFDISYISNWDVSNVTDMDYMFWDAGYKATTWSIGDLSKWDTSKVTNMRSMFGYAGYNALTFDISSISSWNVSNVTTMDSMFYRTGKNATTWNIGDLSKWDVSNVTCMSAMFYEAGYNAKIWNIGNLSNWNTTKVEEMNMMFERAGYNSLSFDISYVSNWDVSNVMYMNYMFDGTGYNATTCNIGNLSNWDTSKVTDMDFMFYRACYNSTNFNIGNLKIYAQNIENMFRSCPNVIATINIYSKPTKYSWAFTSAATNSGSSIVVNYSRNTSNIDNIIATSGNNPNITKGILLD